MLYFTNLEHVKSKDIIILVEIDKFQNLRDENGMLSTDKICKFHFRELFPHALKDR